MLPNNDSFTCDCLIRTQGHRRSLCVTQIIFISNTIPYGVMDCLFSVQMWMIKHLFTLFLSNLHSFATFNHAKKMKPSIHPSTYSFNSTQFLDKIVFYTKNFSNTLNLNKNNPSLCYVSKKFRYMAK